MADEPAPELAPTTSFVHGGVRGPGSERREALILSITYKIFSELLLRIIGLLNWYRMKIRFFNFFFLILRIITLIQLKDLLFCGTVLIKVYAIQWRTL